MQTRLFLFRNLPALELSKLSRKPIDKVFEVFEVNKDTGGELLPKNQEYNQDHLKFTALGRRQRKLLLNEKVRSKEVNKKDMIFIRE